MGKTTIYNVVLEDKSKLILAITDFATEIQGELVTKTSSLEGKISNNTLKYKRETILFKGNTLEEVLGKVREYFKTHNISYIDILPTKT